MSTHEIPRPSRRAYMSAERARLGITQQELADRVGVSQQTISSWERGVTTPGPQRLSALAAVLGAQVLQLDDEERAAGTGLRRHLRPVTDLPTPIRGTSPSVELTADQEAFRDALLERVRSGEPLTTEEIRFFRSLGQLYGLYL